MRTAIFELPVCNTLLTIGKSRPTAPLNSLGYPEIELISPSIALPRETALTRFT
jgi:hypothetical protein